MSYNWIQAEDYSFNSILLMDKKDCSNSDLNILIIFLKMAAMFTVTGNK